MQTVGPIQEINLEMKLPPEEDTDNEGFLFEVMDTKNQNA